jgi:SAM-dependent methyltransferase
MMTRTSILPNIWLRSFENYSEWENANKGDEISTLSNITDKIDDRLIWSRHSFSYTAFCSVCHMIQPMTIDWRFGGMNKQGSISLAWTETACCKGCGLNSRMRALYSLMSECRLTRSERIYMAEQITPAYYQFKKFYPELVGSEYLGAEFAPGEIKYISKYQCDILHEDLTQLSFEDESFDMVITQDVFEHISNYKSAFQECRRILSPGGKMIFTVPFFPNLPMTEVCAIVNTDRSITHLLPPEYHGNPVDSSGSLCFQHFGWDMLDCLRNAGFNSASANLYWGPWEGHFGLSFFVFSADRL